jgi:Glycosyl transferase family 2
VESSNDLTPKISVIVPAMLGFDSVLAALDSWDAQTCGGQLEIIVLCPAKPTHPLPSNLIALETGTLLLHEARAAGVRAATADFVMFAEDHCLPDPDCAEVLIRRIQEPWDAVGTALRSGDPRWAVTQGAFLITYGQWMLPAGGPIAYLPGHNAALRRQLLLDLGHDLEGELLFAAFLMRRLRSEGRAFYVEDRARMRHFDPPAWRRSLRIFVTIGECCGAIRLERSSTAVRILYTLILPVIAARHFARGVIHYVRAGPRAGFGVKGIVAGGLLAWVWAWGEVAGAWKGLARVTPHGWMGEVKPVSRDQIPPLS